MVTRCDGESEVRVGVEKSLPLELVRLRSAGRWCPREIRGHRLARREREIEQIIGLFGLFGQLFRQLFVLVVWRGALYGCL